MIWSEFNVSQIFCIAKLNTKLKANEPTKTTLALEPARPAAFAIRVAVFGSSYCLGILPTTKDSYSGTLKL